MTPRVAAIGFAIAVAILTAIAGCYESSHPTHHAGGTPQGPCWTCE